MRAIAIALAAKVSDASEQGLWVHSQQTTPSCTCTCTRRAGKNLISSHLGGLGAGLAKPLRQAFFKLHSAGYPGGLHVCQRIASGPFVHLSRRYAAIQAGVSQRSALSSSFGQSRPNSLFWFSFRIGTVTTAAAVGVEDAVIKTLGRWQNSAYQQYVKLPQRSLAVVSKRLAQ